MSLLIELTLPHRNTAVYPHTTVLGVLTERSWAASAAVPYENIPFIVCRLKG